MARTIYQYRPINTLPDKAIGVTLPFNKSSVSRKDETANYAEQSNGVGVFNSSYSTEAQSISNLKNLLLTIKGERVMQPRFGTMIYSLIFEQNTDDLAAELDATLREDIAYWLPYIVINDIEILQVRDEYSILIRLHFQVTTSGANRVINILASENSLQIPETFNAQQLTPIGTI